MGKRLPNQVSVTAEVYARLTRDMPRNASGRLRPGALNKRVDRMINDALDREYRVAAPRKDR